MPVPIFGDSLHAQEEQFNNFVELVAAMRCAQRNYDRAGGQEARFRLSSIAGMVDAAVDEWVSSWRYEASGQKREGVDS